MYLIGAIFVYFCPTPQENSKIMPFCTFCEAETEMGVNGCYNGCMVKVHSLKITPEVLSLIAQIDEFKGAWQALSVLEPERLLSLKKSAMIESIGSSTRIEGSDLSDREVEALLGRIKIKSLKTRSEQEVVGYAEVLELVFQSWDSLRINENYIKQLHRDLLRYSKKDEHHRGKYKKSSNEVAMFDAKGKQIGIVFKTASPFDTPRLMKELITWFKETLENESIHPLLAIAVFNVLFLQIHPFQDGNGRLSRLLTTLLLLRSGYAYVPYSSLESLVEQNKKSYYLSLRKTQKTIQNKNPDWQPWLLFFLRMLQKQVITLRKKMKYEKTVIADLPALSVKILEQTRKKGRITMGDMIKKTGASRNTLKEHFRLLMKKGHLTKHGQGRSTWYNLTL